MLDLASLMKYVLEGLAVAVAAYYIPRRNLNLQEVAMIALAAAAAFAVLDLFAPSVASGARHGAGFGIGMNLVGGDGSDVAAEANDSSESEGDSDSSAESSDDASTEDSESNGDSGVNANGEAATEPFTSQPAPLDY